MGCHDSLQHSQRHVDVGVQKKALESFEGEPRGDRRDRKPEHEHGQRRRRASDDGVDRMAGARCQPAELGRRVMDPVGAPQGRHFVAEPVAQ